MDRAEEKMMEAYSKQERIYADILELVKKQKKLLGEPSNRETARIVYLCEEVEQHLEKIEDIETRIEQEKRECLDSEDDLPQTLEEVLGRIAEKIEDTRRLQAEVQNKLAERVGGMSNEVAASDNPAARRRAQKMYSAT
jgi:hypothetical protein